MRCFNLEQQRTILKKFDSLEYCKNRIEMDKAYIDSLQIKYREQLQLASDIESKRKKEARRKVIWRRVSFVGIPLAFGAAWIIK